MNTTIRFKSLPQYNHIKKGERVRDLSSYPHPFLSYTIKVNCSLSMSSSSLMLQ